MAKLTRTQTACLGAIARAALATTCLTMVQHAALAQDSTTALDTITVQGGQQTPTRSQPSAPAGAAAPAQEPAPGPAPETAWGPVDGIVATRSATATKTDTPLIETPASISVITADQVEQQGAQTISEALGYTAGVMPSIYGTDTRFDWISIRGFDAYQPGFYLDGLLARNNNSYAVWKVEPYSAERIEVLKGPASVLYGQSNVGGMVNVVSKRPTEEPLREVGIRVGSHNRVEGVFDFSGPVTQDGKLLYRFTGVGLSSDTQVDFTEQERMFLAPALTWKPTADTSLTLLGQYLKEDDISNIGFLPAVGTLLPNPNGRISRSFFSGEPNYDKFEHEQWSIGYLFEHRFNENWEVRQNARYSRQDLDYKTVFGGGLDVAGDPSLQTLLRSAFTSVEDVESFALDNQLQGKFVTGGIEHTLLAGLDYQNNKFRQTSGIGGAPSINMYEPVYGATVIDPPLYIDADTTMRQTGVYLQEQAKINNWVFVLGGRYDWANSEVFDPLFSGANSQDDEEFTWKASVLYHARNGLAPYYTYSTSFFPVAGIDVATGNPFKPETGEQHEVGLKYQPVGRKSLYTISAFDITRQNYLTYDNTFTPRQTGEIRSRGMEFEAVAELADGFDLIGSYTWLPDFEITKSSDPLEIGQREPIVPEHTASLWLHYRLGYGALAGLGFGGGVRYIGETYGDIANSNLMTVPDYTLFDAVIDYEKDGWRLALNVSNLADETTLTCWDTCYYGNGRTWLASLTRRW